MKSKIIILTTILCSILVIPFFPLESYAVIDFRSVDFDKRGFDIKYEIVQGENLDNIFTDLGFDFKGSLSGGEFHVLLKNKRTNIPQDLYLIETDSFIPFLADPYIFENYIITSNPLEVEFNTKSEVLTDLFWFDYKPIEEEIIQAELPRYSSMFLPSIFTNISRPNFAALMRDADFLNFLPFILGNDYTRYEAEFTALLLNQSFSINIFNQGYDDFMLSLDMKLDPSISLRASWEKSSGLLKSLSIHFVFGEKSSTLVLSLIDYEEIKSPSDGPNLEFFITNSSAYYELYKYQSAVDAQLNDLTNFVNLLNQTIGVKYQLYRNALELDWNMLVYDRQYNINSSTTPLHGSVLSQIDPVINPLWERFTGIVLLIDSLWQQLKDTVQGYQFTLSGVTESLYTLFQASLKVEHQLIDSIHHVIWEISYALQENNTQTATPRIFVQESQINITGWIAYSSLGRLEGFSLLYQKYHYSYHDYIFDDPQYTDLLNDYIYGFYIESAANNLTKPSFQEIAETSYSFVIEQIIFYCILTYAVYRKKRKKKIHNEF